MLVKILKGVGVFLFLLILPMVSASCPEGYLQNGTQCIQIDFLQKCNYEMGTKYYVNDLIKFKFSCPQYNGLTYHVVWRDMEIVYHEAIGTVGVINIEEYQPIKKMKGTVTLEIGDYELQAHRFQVFEEDDFIILGNDFSIPNIGKQVSPSNPTLGWVVLVVVIYLGIFIIPKLLERRS